MNGSIIYNKYIVCKKSDQEIRYCEENVIDVMQK